MSLSNTATTSTDLYHSYQVIRKDTVPSTNAEAIRLAGQGATHGTVIWAREQTAGRGRSGREWISPEGNLYMSLLLTPDVALEDAGQLSYVAAVSMHRALALMLSEHILSGSIRARDADLTLKWPNDLLLNGKKLGGILLESVVRDGKPEFVVIGIGVNILTHPEGTNLPATSIGEIGINAVSAKMLLARFLKCFAEDYRHWQVSGFAPIAELWLHHVSFLGEPIKVHLGERILSGTFETIDAKGALVLRQEDGSVEQISAGEIFKDAYGVC
jgi:BirA family biotin operon repressor/biotin-[acetyl-CoA-carboxylase] ligase